MTAITDKKLRYKIVKEKTLELKKIIELIKQNTYEKKIKNTKPEVLVSSKETQAIKEKPIQRMERLGTRLKNKVFNSRHADNAVFQTGHHCTNAQHQK